MRRGRDTRMTPTRPRSTQQSSPNREDGLQLVVPTPVRRLELPGLRGRLWVKDEGGISPRYGGNKARKLRNLLADAKLRGATDLITVGAVGSHHVLATAIHGAAENLRTHALLFPQPEAEEVRRNARAIDRLCASWTVLPGIGALDAAVHLRHLQRSTGRSPTFVAAGGSSPLGVLGWIEGGLELVEQLPQISRVYVAVGTGGTAAGLLAALALAGRDVEVVGVRVVARWVANAPRIGVSVRNVSPPANAVAGGVFDLDSRRSCRPPRTFAVLIAVGT